MMANLGWGCVVIGTLTCYWWDCEILYPQWKTIWQFLVKSNAQLLYNSKTAFLGIYPWEIKSYYICSHMKWPEGERVSALPSCYFEFWFGSVNCKAVICETHGHLWLKSWEVCFQALLLSLGSSCLPGHCLMSVKERQVWRSLERSSRQGGT